LALLAGVMEPYAPARDELLGRFAGVSVSVEKIERLVAEEGRRAERMLAEPAAEPPQVSGAAASEPCYVGIDGGMIFVEGRWQEAKLGCLYQARDRHGAEVDRGRQEAGAATPHSLTSLRAPDRRQAETRKGLHRSASYGRSTSRFWSSNSPAFMR
jgi:hypothetical protein